MCVSVTDFSSSHRQCRRCQVTDSTRAAAAASRRENRATIRTVSSNARTMFGDAGADQIKNMPPSLLSNLVVSLDAVSPGVGADLLRSESGALRRVPGTHNNVFADRRERTGGAAESNAGKLDPMAVARVQLASAVCERDMILRGAVGDPLEADHQLALIDTRIDAATCGVLEAPMDGSGFGDLDEPVRKFYRRHTAEEVAALTTVSDRLSARLFEDVTASAQVLAADRPLTEEFTARAGSRMGTATCADLFGPVGERERMEVAEGLTITRDEHGRFAVSADGVSMALDGDTRVTDVVRKMPKVDFDGAAQVPDGTLSSGMNQQVQSMLTSSSPRARAMRTAAARRVLQRSFYGDTGSSYLTGADGQTRALNGKARATTAARIASRADSSHLGLDELATATRREGFECARHLRMHRAGQAEFLDSLSEELRHTEPPKAKLAPYRGPVSKSDRAALSRSGWMVRNPKNTTERDYPGVDVAKLLGDAGVDFDAAPPRRVGENVPGVVYGSAHAAVRGDADKMVALANEVARRGRNPELVDTSTLTAHNCMAEAFDVWKVAAGRDRTPRVVTCSQPIPTEFAGREVEFAMSAFAPGSAVTTTGYTMAPAEGRVKRGPSRVRVQYVTGDAMPVTGGDVIDDKTTFRVIASSLAEDGTVEVRAVAENMLAAAAEKTGE